MKYHFTIGYAIIRFFVNTALRLNFRKIIYIGEENFSEDKPVLFAPNHRNAVIDPLLLVYRSRKKEIVFLARADAFKNKTIKSILEYLHIIPVFRMRDGKDNLENNNSTFEISSQLLNKKIPLALFPEGRHNPKQSLLPLQKAIPRIVLPTEAEKDFSLGIEIIPVAIYYPEIFSFLSDVYVTFGTPIPVAQYKKIYEENPTLAANKLRKDIEKSLSNLVVNITNNDYYDQYVSFIHWNAPTLANKLYPGETDGNLKATHFIIKKLDDMFDSDRPAFDRNMNGCQEANTILEKWKLDRKVILTEKLSTAPLLIKFLLLILTSPISLFGFVNGIFPILIYKKLLTVFKEDQFIPSARFASGLLFVPLFAIIQAVLVGFLTQSTTIGLFYFVAMPSTFYFALYCRKWLISTQQTWKVLQFQNNHTEIWQKLCELIRL